MATRKTTPVDRPKRGAGVSHIGELSVDVKETLKVIRVSQPFMEEGTFSRVLLTTIGFDNIKRAYDRADDKLEFIHKMYKFYLES